MILLSSIKIVRGDFLGEKKKVTGEVVGSKFIKYNTNKDN